jgi:hypothetical protein
MKKNAQILITTLLFITIVIILMITVVIITSRDIKQVTTTARYEKALNLSETNLKGAIEKVKVGTLSNLFTLNCISSNLDSAQSLATCNLDNSTENFQTTVTVQDKSSIDDYEAKKDQPIDVAMNQSGTGYNGIINASWDNANVAMEFAIYYKTGNTYKVVRDMWDPTNPDSIIESGRTPAINFVEVIPTSINFNIASIPQIAADGSVNILAMTLTPRTKSASITSTKVNVSASSPNFPKQMREFTSISTNSLDPNSPIARVQTKILLATQVGALFDYSILTEGSLSLP